MKMAMRWFGTGYDPVTLDKLRQVPGLNGIITTLYGVPPGEAWKKEQFDALKKEAEGAGLSIIGIESVGVHDSIKTAGKDRDMYIENYIATLKM
jgi:mannonate dehydratase